MRFEQIIEILRPLLDDSSRYRTEEIPKHFANYSKKISDITSLEILQLRSIKISGRYQFGVKESTRTLIKKEDETGYDLYIEARYYKEQELYNLIIAQQILDKVISNFLESATSGDVSFAIVWDNLIDSRRKDLLAELWEELYPGNYDFDRYTKLNLKGLLEMFSKKKRRNFTSGFDSIMRTIDKKLNRINSLSTVYSSVKLDMSILTNSDYKVWEAIVNLPLHRRKDHLIQSGVSEPTYQKSRKKLLYMRFIRSSRYFSESRIGMKSVIALYQSKSRNYPEFPIITRYYSFKNKDQMNFVNFLTPHKEQTIRRWMNEVGGAKDSRIIGIEREDLRVRSMRPTVYIDEKGDGNWQPPYQAVGDQLELDYQERKILLEMLKGNYLKNDIAVNLKMNRNKVYRTIKRIEESGALWRQYEMEFLTNLERVLVVAPMSVEEYHKFVRLYVPYSPYALLTYVDTIDKSYLVGVIGMLPRFSRSMIHRILTTIKNSWVMTLISSSVTYLQINLQVRKEGWRGEPLPSEFP